MSEPLDSITRIILMRQAFVREVLGAAALLVADGQEPPFDLVLVDAIGHQLKAEVIYADDGRGMDLKVQEDSQVVFPLFGEIGTEERSIPVHVSLGMTA